MLIKNLRKVDKGKLRAFFSVEWPDKMVIHDMKLIENDKGEVWAATPSRVYTDKEGQQKWTSVVHILDQGLLDKISVLARKAYGVEEQPKQQQPDDDLIPF